MVLEIIISKFSCILKMMSKNTFPEPQPDSASYWSGSWGYIFPYCPVDEAIQVRIDPVENSVVAALGNTDGQ